MDTSMHHGHVGGLRDELNFRELGGCRTADGRTVKHGVFYRSGALGEATPEELERISDLGLRFVLDLRCQEEADELPDPVISGAEQIRISGCMDADDNEVNLSPSSIYKLLVNPRRKDPDREESIEAAVAEIYSSLAFDSVAYRRLFAEIESANVPLLFHCTAGKDRTGIAAMLVLMALGVNDQDMIDDFALTNVYRRSRIEAKLADKPLLSKVDVVEKLIRASEGVLPHFGERVLSEIRQEYGSYQEFLNKELGLDEERLTALRDRYLE
ncbi:tyrosine-protein phosphatase [Slackia heliotrinireducens]|uniref:tyrosine-protein phosphatase n=1 Tax=Slackia heliotrinireducens TaxID=84110 RepID=UPI003316482F